MSLERACVNCERCYHLTTLIRRDIHDELYETRISIWDNKHKGEKFYEISEEEKGEVGREVDRVLPGIVYMKVYENDQIYIARNEAMRALETAINTDNQKYDSSKKVTIPLIAFKALENCRHCDYLSPKIVKTIENLS